MAREPLFPLQIFQVLLPVSVVCPQCLGLVEWPLPDWPLSSLEQSLSVILVSGLHHPDPLYGYHPQGEHFVLSQNEGGDPAKDTSSPRGRLGETSGPRARPTQADRGGARPGGRLPH